MTESPINEKWVLDAACKGNHDHFLRIRRLLPSLYVRTNHAPVKKSNNAVVHAIQTDNNCRIGVIDIENGTIFDKAPPLPATLYAAHDDDNLYISVKAEGKPSPAKTDDEILSVEYDHRVRASDWICFYFDPMHDHQNFFRLMISPSGLYFAERFSLLSESASMIHLTYGPKKEGEWLCNPSIDISQDDEGWSLSMAIAWKDFDLTRAPVTMGFNSGRIVQGERPRFTTWSPVGTFGENFDLVYRFNELYFKDSGVAVDQLYLGCEHIGENIFLADLSNQNNAPSTVTLSVTTGANNKTKPLSFSQQITLAPQSTTTVEIPIRWELQDNAPFIRRHPTIEIELRDQQNGEKIYQAVFPLNGILPQLCDGEENVDLPSKTDNNYLRRVFQHVVNTLPVFARLTTADGAESDFVLRSAGGEHSFDLMKQGVLKEVADYLYDLFPDEIAFLLGAAFFVNQVNVNDFTSTNAFCESAYGPQSALRVGSGQCGSFANILNAIVVQLCDDTGNQIFPTVYRVGVNHHVISCIINHEGKRTFIDPSQGFIYWNSTKQRPATIEEIRTGRAEPFENIRYYMNEQALETDLVFMGIFTGNSYPPGAPEI
jgi:hypothetical protein